MDPKNLIENFRNVVTTQYVDFNGRTGRTVFWHYVLCYVLIYIVLSFVESMFGFGGSPYGYYGYYSYYSFKPLTGLLSLALLLPSLGISVRRLHDLGKSGWWVLIGIIPIVGWILLIYWYAQPGVVGDNQFGPAPKTPETPPKPAA